MREMLPAAGSWHHFSSAGATANNSFYVGGAIMMPSSSMSPIAPISSPQPPSPRSRVHTYHPHNDMTPTFQRSTGNSSIGGKKGGHRGSSFSSEEKTNTRHRNIWLLQTLNYIISFSLSNRTTFDDRNATPLYLTNSADTDYGGNLVVDSGNSWFTTPSSDVVTSIFRQVHPTSLSKTSNKSVKELRAPLASQSKFNPDAPLFDLNVLRAINWRHPLLSLVLFGICLLTVAGNCLVVVAVCTKKYLRNPTGYLIVSLAVADLIVGLVVMPLNSLFEMTHHVWLLGLTMCDLFHALDILASTSSIWNLCVISLDRYMAGHDPIGYRDRVSKRRIIFAIIFVWVISACLSFPAIISWRQSSPHLYNDSYQCLFTDSKLYVVFSSLVSFYIPLIIILFAYGRVFLIATRHSKSLKSGIKRVQTRRGQQKNAISRNGTISGENSTLRIHLGRKSSQAKKSHNTLANVILAATNGGRVDCYHKKVGGAANGVVGLEKSSMPKANGTLYKRIAAITAYNFIQSECSSDATVETNDRKSPLGTTNSIDSSFAITPRVIEPTPPAPSPPQLRTFQPSNSSAVLLGTPPRRCSGRSPTASARATTRRDVSFATVNDRASTRRASKGSAYSSHTVVSTISSAATLIGGSYSSVGAHRFFPNNFDAATEAAAATENALYGVKSSDASPSFNRGKCSDDDSISYRNFSAIQNNNINNVQSNHRNNNGTSIGAAHTNLNGYDNSGTTMTPSIPATMTAKSPLAETVPSGATGGTTTSTTSATAAAAAARKRGGMREKSRQMMKYVHEQRAARTLSIVVGVFILCWTPFFLLAPIMVLCKTCIAQSDTYFSVITWAGHLNSMLNPLIYSRFSRDFRKAFKQILTCQRERTTKKAIRTPLNLMLAQLASIAQVPTLQPGTAASTRAPLPISPLTHSQLLAQRGQPHSQSDVELSRLAKIACCDEARIRFANASKRQLQISHSGTLAGTVVRDSPTSLYCTRSGQTPARARRTSVHSQTPECDHSCASVSSVIDRVKTTVVCPNTTVTIVQV